MEQTAKTYNREEIRNLWRRYKYEGDRQSGNEFAAIANAQSQNYKTFQAEIDRECREEDMEFRYESRANTRAAPEQRHRAGIELYEKAQEFKQRRPELSDQATFKLAILQNPILAEQYGGFPVRRDAVDDVDRYLDEGTNISKDMTATARLSRIADRLRKLPDRTHDWPAVVPVFFQYPSVIEQAARETMDRLIKDLIREERIWVKPFEYDDVKERLEPRLRAKHPDLAKTLDNPNNVNERVLKLMLPEERCRVGSKPNGQTVDKDML